MHRINCPACGHRLKYEDEYIGRKAKCQKCGARFLLPHPRGAGSEAESHEERESPTAVTPAENESREGTGKEIRTRCPHCSAEYDIVERYVGKSVSCKECGEKFTIEVAPEPAKIFGVDADVFINILGTMAEQQAKERREIRDNGWMCCSIGLVVIVVAAVLSLITPLFFYGALIVGGLLMLRGAWAVLTGRDIN